MFRICDFEEYVGASILNIEEDVQDLRVGR